MKMRLINGAQPHRALAHLRIEFLEGGHESRTLSGIRTLEPVSYTHLDVYKRQTHQRQRVRQANSTSTAASVIEPIAWPLGKL